MPAFNRYITAVFVSLVVSLSAFAKDSGPKPKSSPSQSPNSTPVSVAPTPIPASAWTQGNQKTPHLIPETLLGPAPPYVPRATDYAVEVGLMRSDEDSFWFAGDVG